MPITSAEMVREPENKYFVVEWFQKDLNQTCETNQTKQRRRVVRDLFLCISAKR